MKRIEIADGVVLEIRDEVCENCLILQQELDSERKTAEEDVRQRVVFVLQAIRMEFKPRSYGFDAGFNNAMDLLNRRLSELLERPNSEVE